MRRSFVIGGCGFAADPDSDSLQNPVFWDASVDAGFALLQRSEPHFAASIGSEFSVRELSAIRRRGEVLYGVVGAKRDRMPVLLPPNTAIDGALVVAIPTGSDAQRWLNSATRLVGLLRGKAISDPRISPLRRLRLRQLLRAFDARLCRASHREIAEALFGKHRISGPDWHESSLRYATIRLVHDGNALVRGGYRTLLKPRGRG